MFKNCIKNFLVLYVVFMLAFISCGCAFQKTHTTAELSEKILTLTSFSKMKSLSGISLPSYFVFRDGDVKRFNVMVSANAESADTLACFEVIDQKQRATTVSGISSYLASQSNSFKSTIVKEYNKVQNRLLMELDNIIILVVCNDTTAIWTYLTEIGAKEVV